MKNNIIVLLLILNSIVIFGQEKENLNLLETDSTWSKEIFTFPIHFAKEINYKGYEEAHFPKGWRQEDNNEFWSYVFAWNINISNDIAEIELETNLQLYFDGLMNLVNKDKDKILPKTVAQFRIQEGSNAKTIYVGTIETYDSFVTKKQMTLNVLVESHFCEQNNKSIILFRFSPKEFKNSIWDLLNKVKLRANICKN